MGSRELPTYPCDLFFLCVQALYVAHAPDEILIVDVVDRLVLIPQAAAAALWLWTSIALEGDTALLPLRCPPLVVVVVVVLLHTLRGETLRDPALLHDDDRTPA